MNRKKIIVIIVLMSIALAGIIGVQALWVNNAVSIKEKQFEQNVFAALKNIVLKLKTQSVAIELKGELNSIDTNLKTSLCETDSTKKITIISMDMTDSSKLKEISNLEKVFKKLKIEIQTNDNPLTRLNLKLLDTIIKKELVNTGIDLKYEFAVVSEDKEIKYSSNNYKKENLDSKFKTNIFAYDITEKEYLLVLDFPDSLKYIYQSVFGLLIFSIIFTLIILITFIITINVILKQKKLSEIKSDFINNITHELKTPIATLKVAITTLKQDKSIKSNDTVELIERQGNRLQKITDRVIDSSFNNVPNLKKEKINVNNYLVNLFSDFEKLINDNTINLQYNFNKNSDIVINIDKLYLWAAINNVLDNAVKYNNKKEKQIFLSVYKKNQLLIIEIQDNGIGIPDKDKKRVFDKFYRGLKGNLHDVKGLGIGLFFTKQIIELHNGKISFESKENIGTKFKIELPVYE